MYNDAKNTSKRLRVPAAVLALMLALSAVPASAATATVTVSRLNVRTQPNTDSHILTVARQGAQLPVLENENNGWLKVEVNGAAGYVFAEYAKVSNAASDSASSGGSAQTNNTAQTTGTTQTTTAAQTGVVTVDKLNVRSGPSTSSKALGVVRKGTALPVTGLTGDWMQVSYNGGAAYVSAAYVRLSAGSGSSANTTTATTTPATTAALQKGSHGDAVKAMQRKLIALGHLSGGADGIFGPATKKAVTAFQQANGLNADGVADAQTLSAIDSASTAAKAAAPTAPASTAVTLKKGSTGDAVKAMQRKLIALGYLSGGADGIFGPATKKAVTAFQTASGLVANGVADAFTLTALETAAAAPPTTAPTQSADQSGTQPSASAAQTTAVDHSSLASQAINETNSERVRNGLPALATDADLNAAAQIRAREIAQVFDHTRPDGSSWYTVSGKAAGENIASGYTSASGVVSGWMNSESHRANIMDSSFTSIGVACVQIGGVYYWVQLFGR